MPKMNSFQKLEYIYQHFQDNKKIYQLDPDAAITTKSYQISSEMDVETMPHAMYFSGSKETIAKVNQVPYQIIEYDDKDMLKAKLMDNTQVQVFIDNGATPSILSLNI